MTQLTPPQAFHEAQRLIRMGDYPRAAGLTQQLLQNIPDEPAIRGLHGIATARMGLPERGLVLLSEACERASDDKVRLFLLTERAWVLRSLNRAEEARASCESAREIDAASPEATAALAECLVDMGLFDEARALIHAAAEDEGAAMATARGRLSLLAGRPDDGADALARACERVGVAAFELERMLRLLGELREVQGRHEEALRAFRRGARLRRAEFDPEAHRAMVNELIAGWTPAGVAKVQRPEVDGERAVVLLGSPGSGQDLAERVIASHPDGFGAGELLALARVARAGLGAQARSFRHVVQRPNMLKGKQLKAAGAAYLAQLQEFAPEGRRVADSNTMNLYLAGLVPLMFARVNIVFCVREPAEGAWSWFTSIPGPSHPYAQDPADLMSQAEDARRLCAHWRGLFGAMGVAFHEFSVDRFAAAPEQEARSLIEAVGLAYDPRCAEPHVHAVTRTGPRDLLRLPIERWADRYAPYRGLLNPGFEGLSGGG